MPIWLLSVLYNICHIHLFVKVLSSTAGNHVAINTPMAQHWESFGVQRLAQGNQMADPLHKGQSTLHTELLPPQEVKMTKQQILNAKC